MPTTTPADLASLQAEISALSARLEQARTLLGQWSAACARLAESAAAARAENQRRARAMEGALKGPELRAAMRRTAESAIAEQERRKADDQVRLLQAELTLKRERFRALAPATGTGAADPASLLRKLLEAYDLGLLTEEEYEAKRRRIAGGL